MSLSHFDAPNSVLSICPHFVHLSLSGKEDAGGEPSKDGAADRYQ